MKCFYQVEENKSMLCFNRVMQKQNDHKMCTYHPKGCPPLSINIDGLTPDTMDREKECPQFRQREWEPEKRNRFTMFIFLMLLIAIAGVLVLTTLLGG